ncbi:ribulokinase [Reichenbachiella agariperforans]|uniref:Ribulokinase n=1 Tax=Reichenbachiella agariperforans TaxID=156994 RepID=A0A1M6UAR4_REIAG|nr:ribulokinase [Reichenbachiella agariperforans]MBU2912546.1 ribulokinase [Reichenbachiella agariperforans]SHK66158.1 L-ribulokinase [Reichenbachiella agariperforans]
MKGQQYTIGLDFGSDSVRALVVNVETGEEVATAVCNYPRWAEGQYCIPHDNQFRQHPLDYIEAMTDVITRSMLEAGSAVSQNVIGIGVDTTGSTPVPVDAAGTPLALKSEFAENPNAMFHLWKDHTALQEATEINAINAQSNEDYLKYVGGIYSSEWYWAKIAHTNRVDPVVKSAAYTWVEHCDWIPFLLTGGNKAEDLKRSVCAAGHKALWHKDYHGVPPKSYLTQIDSSFAEYRTELLEKTYSSDETVGQLTGEWADKLGLSTDVVVAVGAFDCHMGAVGGEIEPGYLSKIVGTSTCDIMVAPLEAKEHLVKGICGQVNGSVIPNMLGLEAGQSAFGDVYAWFKRLLLWPVEHMSTELKEQYATELDDKIIPALAEAAAQLETTANDPVALDWMNGRRTPDANQALKGVLSGINLGTDAPRLFKSLVEATCFGAKRISDRFADEGVEIKGVIALGGIAKKSKLVMQTLSDVMQMPIKVASSEQTCALGAAMFAAVAAGKYEKVEQAMKAMGGGFEKTYQPNADKAEVYAQLYVKYCQLGESIEKITMQ